MNLITDSLETNFLGDKRVVMFRLRDENTFNAKWYPEQVDKTEQELSKYKSMRKQAIEKLLCWGETVEPEFQSSMLEVLEFNSEVDLNE